MLAIPPPCGRTRAGGSKGLVISHRPSGTIHPHRPLPMTGSTTNCPCRTSCYGARRITRALKRKGVDVARCTVERLMCELGLEGVIRGQRRRTTVSEPSAPRPPDLVDRKFTASRPDELWVADMTYVRTSSGWAYVAFVLDVCSRMIVGWQVAGHMRTELPLDAHRASDHAPTATGPSRRRRAGASAAS
ncbi:IS3 family transposase [Streptomyces flaveolus]|uniref:IS3 family transposase n=1 Tax=Streptomyces flaveolus TaxID=67297 RepID=UPI003406BE09